MAGISSLNFRLTANIKPFRTGLNKAERAMDRMGRKMQQTGKNLSMKLTAPITALGAMSFNVFKGFEAEMAKVKAVSGATAEEFKMLSDNAKELGRSTIFSAREVAGLQTEFAKLGFTAKQIEGVTEATLNLAQASGSDLARAAEVAGATLRGFGFDVSETGRVTDVMAKSFSTSSMDMESFAEGMKMVAPIAKSAGMSLEETTAMMSLLANAGVKGSMAGTQLRRIISELATTGKPTTEAIRDLAASGLTLVDAKDEVGRAAQGALTILAEGVDQIDPLTKSFEESAGAAKSMADVMNLTAEGATKALGSAVEGVAIEFGALIAVALVPLIKKLTSLAAFINELSPAMKKLIAVIAGIAAVAGPAIFLFGGLARSLVVLRNATILQTIATKALAIVTHSLFLPITAIVALIAALAAGVIYVAYNFKAFSATARNAIASMVNAVIPKVNGLISAFNEAAEFFGRDKIMVKPFQKMEQTAVPAFKSISEVVTEIKKDLGLFKEETEETTGSLGTLEGQVEDLNQDLNNGIVALDNYGEALDGVTDSDGYGDAFNVNLDPSALEDFDPLPFDEEKTNDKFENLRKNYVRLKLAQLELAENGGKAIENFARNTISGMAEIAGAMMVGEASFADMGRFILGSFADLLMQLGQMFIQYSIAVSGFVKALLAGPTPIGAGLALAAGVAMIAAAGAIKASMSKAASGEGGIPALAEGGIVTGPTLALIGEGRESEAVIPLSKLNTMMQGGGNGAVEVYGRLSGQDILLSSEKATRTRSRYRGF